MKTQHIVKNAPLKVAMFPDYRQNNPYQTLLAEHLRAENVEVCFPCGYRRGLHFTRTLGGMKTDSPELLHLHWPDPYLAGRQLPIRFLYAWKLRLDLLLALRNVNGFAWTVHNFGRHDATNDPVEQPFYRWLARRADVLFVHDDSLVEKLKQAFRIDCHKIEVVPHGHFRRYYSEMPDKKTARQQLKLPENAKIVLFLGMLRPYKGIRDLLQVWPEVIANMPEAHLVIAGGGSDYPFIEKVKELCSGLSNVHLYPRFVDDAEIPVFYGAADIAVFPFKAITTSGSLILALSYNRPVVAPKVPSIIAPLQFQKELLYEQGSLPGLQAALLTGLKADTSRMSEGFERIRAAFSWEKAAHITRRGYMRSLGK